MSSRKDDETPLDPAAAAELAAMDAALEGGDVAPEQADLAELAVDLRALREEPDPGFLNDLDARMARDIAATEAKPAVPWYRRPLLVLAPAAGALAAVVIAVVIATGGSSDDGSTPPAAVERTPPQRSFDAGAAGAPSKRAAAGFQLGVASVPAGAPILVDYKLDEGRDVIPVLTPKEGGKRIKRDLEAVPAGQGTLAIPTDGVPPGVYTLKVGPLRETVTITR